MIRDRDQKQLVLRYVLSRQWFPQVELDVSSYLTIGKRTLNITDIDVLACIPDDFCAYRKLLVDCKTKKGESPINRAMWLKGVIERFDGDIGISVLRATIVPDHRYTAAQLGITLLAENEFRFQRLHRRLVFVSKLLRWIMNHRHHGSDR